MAQTPAGAEKAAATRAGLTVEEYRSLRAAGLKRCARCKGWKAASDFGADRPRGDATATCCRACRQRGAAPRGLPRRAAGPREQPNGTAPSPVEPGAATWKNGCRPAASSPLESRSAESVVSARPGAPAGATLTAAPPRSRPGAPATTSRPARPPARPPAATRAARAPVRCRRPSARPRPCARPGAAARRVSPARRPWQLAAGPALAGGVQVGGQMQQAAPRECLPARRAAADRTRTAPAAAPSGRGCSPTDSQGANPV